jgi:hypothetical protein
LLNSINTSNTAITNLHATSTTILGLVNGHTTQITVRRPAAGRAERGGRVSFGAMQPPRARARACTAHVPCCDGCRVRAMLR